MKNKIIKIVKWYLIIHITISSMLLIDYAFFVKESTKITWEGRGYPVTKMYYWLFLISFLTSISTKEINCNFIILLVDYISEYCCQLFLLLAF